MMNLLKTKSELEQTIEEFSQLIRRVVKTTSPKIDSSDLDDIEQEVKLKIWKELLKSEKKIYNLGSYIWRITYTTTCNMMKKKQEQKIVSIDGKMIEQNIYQKQDDEKNVSIEDRYKKEKLLNLLEKAIDSLIDSRRQVLKLYLLGMSKDEISSFLGWTTNKVRNLLYRGLDDLRCKLKSEGIEAYF
jgi:RNA polymerase sigma-70 factor (ECF subfamily)